ncbi:TetR/AcrR family transcriptional regulator [Planomonospora venezuelensis]|uniref:AcrR family transcriptional regulator n=1 Tax=Planomonospora venezuelensis TaxID=1999 RepID=A0A841DA43_PLAVE|nr:TetR/AcrR family transcriptional regulator [Planomonospora venezuelensis]MBB5965713.1 AcrR family transcriptional regulator [Planomonospora venezuelensis]GIN04262.1 transcriptional regulator [Planomonospora venezuelensis]
MARGQARGTVRRRLERPREQMLEAAMEAIAEYGPAEMTMAELARRLGTSGGHVLYYFGSKDQVLLETLRWSEEKHVPGRAALLAAGGSALERLPAFVELYLPEGAADPRWLLWVHVWGRTLAVPELRDTQLELDLVWHRDLVALLEQGARGGEFAVPVDLESFSVRLRAMLDGFSTQLVIGVPGVTRESSLAHAMDYARQALVPPAPAAG